MSPRPENRRSQHATPKAPSSDGPSPLLASALGFTGAIAVGGAIAWGGCKSQPPPGDERPPERATSLPAPSASAVANAPSSKPSASASVAANDKDAGASADKDKPWTGPMLGALGITTLVYPTPDFTKKPGPIGYLRQGAKVPLESTSTVKGQSPNCPPGWYKLVDGGFVCGKYGTPDVNSAQVKLGITAPTIDELLPYKYAYNNADGTPLYRSVPSREEMLKYEPYLDKKKKKKDDDADPDPGVSAVPQGGDGDHDSALAAAAKIGLLDAGAPADEEQQPPKPWWDHDAKEKSPSVKLADLESEADGTIAKRMVKGFFVAVDKQFGWNNRLWYKTTGGLVAPSDRMYLVKAPATQGMEFPDGVSQIGFITVSKSTKWDYDTDKKSVKANGTLARFASFGLTGATVEVNGQSFRQTTEGWYMKAADGTFTEPGPKPASVEKGEKWIDVNLTRKTLVAFDGDKPYYAALVSPGKRSKDKKKDHATIQGTFRIREKHIAVTMDGDGKSASDLPYSIEDVPYVEYFEGSYALHAAFWHNNFGREMSHGCVNLAPLDAKKLFYWTEPELPRGWHAVWATSEHKGTTVVTHE